MKHTLISKLGGQQNRRIYYMPVNRSLKLSAEEADTVGDMYEDCMRNRGILLVQPEHILSFKLMAIEALIARKDDLARSLLRTQELFDTKSRDIVDESDENFSVKFEMVYTMGTPRPTELSPDRWTIVHLVLDLVRIYAPQVKKQLPDSIEIISHGEARYPRVRVLETQGADLLLKHIAAHLCHNGIPGIAIARQSPHLRQAILLYIRDPVLSEAAIKAVEEDNFYNDTVKGPLLLLRGLLACGLVRFALMSKRWRVNYGLDLQRSPKTCLAVPYRSKDSPAPKSEFSHPDVVLVLTSLTFYYGGLTDENLFDTFTHLARSDHADIEYEQWVRAAQGLPEDFHYWNGVNTEDKQQCISEIFPFLRYCKPTIDFFLSNIIFPKEMRQHSHKLSASGWDIGQKKAYPTTGFSGTNDTRVVLPLGMNHLALPDQEHTDASVLDAVLREENTARIVPPKTNGASSDAEHLLSFISSFEDPPRVIIDVGAQILELGNLEVAEKWLEMNTETTIRAAVYFADDEELMVVDHSGRVDLLQSSPFSKDLGECLIYLDEAHTRGTDLKLPRGIRAAVTLGTELTKDRLVQACMRMRQLGDGQAVVFCIPEEIQKKIQECNKSKTLAIKPMDVICWCMKESWADLERSIPLWATQGYRFENQRALWQSTRTTEEQAKAFLEEESQTIESRYGPRRNTSPVWLRGDQNTSNENIKEILKRCREFDTSKHDSATLQGEQERELAPEVEEERQIQRPAPMQPREHELHQDLVVLVKEGSLPKKSTAVQPAFEALSTTSAGKLFTALLGQFSKNILVTYDYICTVEEPQGPSASTVTSDSYQQAVQWVVSVAKRQMSRISDRTDVLKLIVISPYEAEQLLPIIEKYKKVTLHLYAPRINLTYEPLDDLSLYCAGRRFDSLTIPRHLIMLLNLFAGQLYFRSYDEYVELCKYLGLAFSATRENQEGDASSGFILPPSGGAGLQANPMQFLKELLVKVRREGKSVDKSHVGRMLEGNLLKRVDFGEKEPEEGDKSELEDEDSLFMPS